MRFPNLCPEPASPSPHYPARRLRSCFYERSWRLLAAIDLPEVNVCIALSAPDHVHRAKAEQYWKEEASSCQSRTLFGVPSSVAG